MKNKIIIGIDPGKQTGLAFAIDGKITELCTVDFWTAYDRVRMWAPECVEIHIEDTSDLPVIGRPHTNRHAHGKIGRNVGGVCREAELLISGFRRLGYTVIPHRNKKSSKMDAKTFNRITGWEGRTNQHQRDAAVLVI